MNITRLLLYFRFASITLQNRIISMQSYVKLCQHGVQMYNKISFLLHSLSVEIQLQIIYFQEKDFL